MTFKVAGAVLTATNGRFEGIFHPIPLPLWRAILGFHRQVSINENAESVSYHRWCEAEACYHTLIPWQQTDRHGLRVHVDWQDKRNIELLNNYAAKYGEEFLPACTIHTHVDAMAFESGTDAGDEREAPGWHITLGHLVSKARYDLHCRMRLPGLKSLKALVDTSQAYKLNIGNLMLVNDESQIVIESDPGTTDFHHLLSRVHAS